jgi:hypothetical protein
VLGDGTLWHLHKFLQYIKYTWIHPLHHSSLSPHPYSWNSFNRYHFPIYVYMCTQYLRHTHSPIPFPHTLVLTTLHPCRICSALLFSNFVKAKKKWYFCSFKIATQGVSLWHFHVYLYYSPIRFISSLFLFYYHSLFLMVVSASLKILYWFLYRAYISHIHLLNFFLLPSPSHMWPPLSMTCFS